MKRVLTGKCCLKSGLTEKCCLKSMLCEESTEWKVRVESAV